MNELVEHFGAIEVVRSELDIVETPAATETWYPLKHSVVLNAVEETLDKLGFVIERQWLSLSHGRHRFFGVLHLDTRIVEGVALSVAVRNSTDKSIPIGFMAGSQTLACSNLSFSADMVISNRHTKKGSRRFQDGIVKAVGSLRQFAGAEKDRISAMRKLELTAADADSIMLRAFESRVVGARLLPQLIKEWRAPRHVEFKPRTAFSLLSCFTEVIKPRFRSLPHFAATEILKFQSLVLN